MAQLIRIGKVIVNLDHMTHALPNGSGTLLNLYFSGEEEDYLTFRGMEADALTAYLQAEALDVVDYHTEALAEQAAVAAHRRARAGCVDADGHLWGRGAAGESFSCLHCGADSGQTSSATLAIELFGGRLVPEPVS